MLSEWLLVNSDVFKVFLICISAHVSEFRLCGPNLILLLFFWRLVQYWFESLCFDFRCSVHAPVLGLTCKPIPLSYCAHPRPICLLGSRLSGSHLKSFGYVNPARLSLICKSRLKWYGGSVDLMQSNTSTFVSLRITKVGLCSLYVEKDLCGEDFLVWSLVCSSRSDQCLIFIFVSYRPLADFYSSHLHLSRPAAVTKPRSRTGRFQSISGDLGLKSNLRPNNCELHGRWWIRP